MDAIIRRYTIALVVSLLLVDVANYYKILPYANNGNDNSYGNNNPQGLSFDKYNPPSCNVTYYQFALLRSPIKNPEPPNNLFLIHGLWPDQCTNCMSCGYPTFCQKVYFNLTLLRPLFTQLQLNWFPHVNPEVNHHLLEHEWLKHGSCTHFEEFEYFNTSLNIYQRLIESGRIYDCPNSNNYVNNYECHFYLDHNLQFVNKTIKN